MQKKYMFILLPSQQKYKDSKEDLHKLTQCHENGLFRKKNHMQILKMKKIVEKV